MTQKRLSEFRECLREERFYDAHEALEALWFPRRFEQNFEVQLLKGFINAAVSFELKKRGRVSRSKDVWRNYLKYRQLLFKVNSPYLNSYYQLSREIDLLKVE